jgi:hypothetical protein
MITGGCTTGLLEMMFDKLGMINSGDLEVAWLLPLHNVHSALI